MSKGKSHTEVKKGSILPWATAVMMVCGIAVITAIYWNRNLEINEVSFNGQSVVEEQALLLAADIPLGINPDSLDLEEVILKLESIDYVKAVTPFIEPNGNVEIRVEERTPIAMLVENGERIYVDKDGIKLPIKIGHTFDTPLLYGFSANENDTLKSNEFAQISDFLQRAKQNEFGWITISEVAYDPALGVVALSQENGVKLLFGNNEFQTKLENWEAFYTKVIKVKGIRAMQQVDLRFTNQIVTKEI